LNILLERKGKTQTPVLIDLGLGKVMDKESAVDDEFQTVGCLGTSTHMAPEMASQGKWSSKTDMFAMGVIMWEILTGEYPYRGMGWNQVLSFVVRKDGRPDNAGQMDKAKVSKANQEIIKSLWHKDPAVRPSAEEFLSRLEQSNGKT
jgi:serine/threonine protein kinase